MEGFVYLSTDLIKKNLKNMVKTLDTLDSNISAKWFRNGYISEPGSDVQMVMQISL